MRQPQRRAQLLMARPPSTSSLQRDSSLSNSAASLTSLAEDEPVPYYLTGRDRSWLRRVWGAHFFVSLCIIALGILHNETSKYVPISPEKAGETCLRAFLNVLAPSDRVDNAIVCCTNDTSLTGICPSETGGLPFANRLARWPDAWLLPLFPLLLRILITARQSLQIPGGRRYRSQDDSRVAASWLAFATALRRLGYYIILLNFRGWVLYVGLNAIEDLLVRPVDADTCWYHTRLRHDQPQCFGRVFDFSDHMVLYYAQILPVSLFEFLHSMEHPYWVSSAAVVKHPTVSAKRRSLDVGLESLLPLGLCAGMFYLYLITCLGVYKTAVFFHTGTEVVVGFLISMLVHVPLCLIQCSDHLEPMRDFLFTYSNDIPVTRYRSLS